MGWYATGTELSDADMAIQRKVGTADVPAAARGGCRSRRTAERCRGVLPAKNPTSHPAQLMDINESPVFLRLDPSCEPSRKDLPVYLYESGGCLQS